MYASEWTSTWFQNKETLLWAMYIKYICSQNNVKIEGDSQISFSLRIFINQWLIPTRKNNVQGSFLLRSVQENIITKFVILQWIFNHILSMHPSSVTPTSSCRALFYKNFWYTLFLNAADIPTANKLIKFNLQFFSLQLFCMIRLDDPRYLNSSTVSIVISPI